MFKNKMYAFTQSDDRKALVYIVSARSKKQARNKIANKWGVDDKLTLIDIATLNMMIVKTVEGELIFPQKRIKRTREKWWNKAPICKGWINSNFR